MSRLWGLFCVAVVAAASGSFVGCDGGDGSTGDDACDRACPDGRSCNAASGRCECTTSPDSCAPFGQVCNSARICVAKPPPAPEATEWSKCAVPGESDGSGLFVCLGPMADESNVWVRRCEDNDSCADRKTVCMIDPNGSKERVCWFNRCGEDAVKLTPSGEPELDSSGEPILQNGLNWGPCDTATGEASSTSSGDGSCLPATALGETVFLCHSSGARRLGEWCKPSADRNDWEGCEQGTSCVPPPVYRKPCYHDRECYSTQYCTGGTIIGPGGVEMEVIGFCDDLECAANEDCGAEGFCEDLRCRPLGACTEVCNGGSAGAEAGEYASCGSGAAGLNLVCNGGLPPDPGSTEHINAYCQPDCDPFGEDVCSAQLGEEATCVPTPSPSNFLGGSCEPVGAAQVEENGDLCSDRGICPTGSTCRGTISQAPICRPLCVCEGEGGWDSFGRCLTSSSQCDEDASCYQMELGNPSLGACVGPADEEAP